MNQLIKKFIGSSSTVFVFSLALTSCTNPFSKPVAPGSTTGPQPEPKVLSHTSIGGVEGKTCQCKFTPDPNCLKDSKVITLSAICPTMKDPSCRQEVTTPADHPATSYRLYVACAVLPADGDDNAETVTCLYESAGCEIK